MVGKDPGRGEMERVTRAREGVAMEGSWEAAMMGCQTE